MKSWESIEADKTCIVGSHRYTAGRSGHTIDRIVIHHNAGVHMSTGQCRDMWNSSREAGAHYQVEADGTIGQLVNDWDTAWHAANANINARSIGIEHANISAGPRWQISDATVENGAHLVAALCRFYNLGRPEWGKNVFPHSAYAATGCPWQLDLRGEDHAHYMARAAYWYDHPAGETTPEPEPAKKGLNPMELVKALLAVIVTQLVGAGRDPQGNPTYDGFSVDFVYANAKRKQFKKLTLMEAVIVNLVETRALNGRVSALEKKEAE